MKFSSVPSVVLACFFLFPAIVSIPAPVRAQEKDRPPQEAVSGAEAKAEAGGKRPDHGKTGESSADLVHAKWRAAAEKETRRIVELQKTPLALRILSRYPSLPLARDAAYPRIGEIRVNSIEKPFGSECDVATVWRPGELLSDWPEAASRVEDLWGVFPDGSLRLLGSRNRAMFRFYEFDAHLIQEFLYRCVKKQTLDSVGRFLFDLTMYPVPAFHSDHDPPLVVPVDRLLDLPDNLPEKTRACFLAESEKIAKVLTRPPLAMTKLGYVMRRCVAYTNVVDPLWSVADLVCFGYVFSKDLRPRGTVVWFPKLVHVEVLYHKQCGSYFQ